MYNTFYGTSSNSASFFYGSSRSTNLSLSTVAVLSSLVAGGLLPVALVGNALVQAAICNTFLRTPFQIVLSGLALPDILRAILSQPSYIVWAVICFAKHGKKYNYLPFTYFARVKTFCWRFLHLLTLLLLTLVSIERWLHMARESSLCAPHLFFHSSGNTSVHIYYHGLHHVVENSLQGFILYHFAALCSLKYSSSG